MSSFDTNPGNHSRAGSLASLFSQMIRLPILAIVYGMEIFVKTVHGFQQLADQSVDALTEPAEAAPLAPQAPCERPPAPADPAPALTGTQDQKPEEVRKEQTKMPDTNLNDDMLKLVRYKILFVKRDYEVAFQEQEELVFDNMTDTAFAAWKVAEFIQALDHTVVPHKWMAKHYPPGRREHIEHGNRVFYIHSLPEDDKKYLRVYFEVLQRYTREKFRHDEREVEELENIRRILDQRLQGPGGAVATGGPPAGAQLAQPDVQPGGKGGKSPGIGG